MIEQLFELEHFSVEECPKIEEIITKSKNRGLEPKVLPKLKTQKLNRNLKTLQREILTYLEIWTPVEPSSKVLRCARNNQNGFLRAEALGWAPFPKASTQ